MFSAWIICWRWLSSRRYRQSWDILKGGKKLATFLNDEPHDLYIYNSLLDTEEETQQYYIYTRTLTQVQMINTQVSATGRIDS